jgi:hypothetical protein
MEQNNPLEQNSITQSTSSNLFDLQVDHETMSYLGETARWAKFFAIVGFIGIGLLVLFGVFAGSILSSTFFSRYGFGSGMGAGFGFLMAVIYIGVAVLYFFPCLYLFNFATKMQVALRSNDQVQLNTSFRNLKSCYKFMGILLIITLAFYGLAFIFMIIGAAFR